MAWQERSPKGTGHLYTYGWFILLYSGKQQNLVKQLYSNKGQLKKLKYKEANEGEKHKYTQIYMNYMREIKIYP